jgi:spore coat polysaccharide biosynthesis protein SpsF
MNNAPNIVTIVQARMSSSRLPGKVMKTVLDKSMLELQLERMAHSEYCGQIVVATSKNINDDIIEEFCNQNEIEIYRGDENDVLNRHYECALKYKADIVAKIPSDCPLIDYKIMDKVFSYFFANQFDYVSNLHPASYPDGNDVEVFTFSALEKANYEANKKLEREHTTPYFWENSRLFKIGNIKWDKPLDYSMSHRFTLDYNEDFLFIKRVFEELYPSNRKFSLNDILELLETKPEIYEINSNYAGVNWYRNHLDELQTIKANQTKQL